MIVIFDMDGTVWHSERGIVGSLEHTFAHFDLPVPDREVLTANLGPPLQLMLAELGVPEDRVDEAVLVYREDYVARGAYDAELYDGIVDVLDTLRADGHRLATATSKGEGPTRQMLDHFDLAHRFDVVGAASMDASAITKEAVLGRTLSMLGDPDASSCRMVGDRSYDVTGARRYDIDCVGVLWGYGSRDELVEAGAWRIAEQPSDLVELLDLLA